MPARKMPTTTNGASICSSATSGWVFAQSMTFSRLASAPTMLPGTTAWPRSLSCASGTDAQYTSRPSRNDDGPKSSSPVCSTAAAMSASASRRGSVVVTTSPP